MARHRSLVILLIFLAVLSVKASAFTSVSDSLLGLLKKNPSKDQKCAILSELAWETRVSNLDKAERYAKEALTLADELNDDKKRSTVFNTLGNIKKDKGLFNDAMSYYLKALKIQERLGDKKAISAGYINISNIHFYTNNPSKALEYLQKALSIKRELKDDKGIAGCLNNIGNLHLNVAQYDSALKYFQESLDIRIKIGSKQGISASLANLAGLYQHMKKPEMSILYFEKAIAIKRELGDSIGMISTFINAAESYKALGRNQRARDLFNSALEIGRMLDAKDDLKNALSGIADLNFREGRYKDAYLNLESYIKVNDSIMNEAVTRAQAEMSTKYETEKKEQQIELLNKDKLLKDAEIEQQRTFRNLSIAVGASVTLLAFALFFAFRQKHQSNLILTAQKEEILEKNQILTQQKEEIQVQKKEITDSINYAKKIQQSILPSEKEMLGHFSDGFILFKPKDIVSGDFYWCRNSEDVSFVVAADSTGHGVPGALMSMIGAEKLAASCKENRDPGEILRELNNHIRTALKQDVEGMRTGDGMDLALIKVDRKNKKVIFSGANRPLWIIGPARELVEIKGNKLSVGGNTGSGTSFEEHEIEFLTGSRLYLFSDGYADQFGGEDGKKLMKKNFKALLESVQQLPLKAQKEKLERFFESWRGTHEQVDDVMVVGIEL